MVQLGLAEKQECPKTLVDELTLRDHRKLVVHQVARWLETCHTATCEFDRVPHNAAPPNSRMVKFDFDNVLLLKEEEHLRAELLLLQTIFDHLRAGRVQEL